MAKVYPKLEQRSALRAGQSASQMLSNTPDDPVQAAQPLRPQGTPPSSDHELINRLANDPNGAATYGAHLDSVHKAVQMQMQGGFDKIKYPTVTDIEKREFVSNTRGNAAQVAVKASQNGSIGVGQAIDIMHANGALDDSTANAAKSKLAPVIKTGR